MDFVLFVLILVLFFFFSCFSLLASVMLWKRNWVNGRKNHVVAQKPPKFFFCFLFFVFSFFNFFFLQALQFGRSTPCQYSILSFINPQNFFSGITFQIINISPLFSLIFFLQFSIIFFRSFLFFFSNFNFLRFWTLSRYFPWTQVLFFNSS